LALLATEDSASWVAYAPVVVIVVLLLVCLAINKGRLP
jgi:hypothetical protein